MARRSDRDWIRRTLAVQRAVDFGVDVTLLLEDLKYSPTERVRRAQRSLESTLALTGEVAEPGKRRASRS